MVLKTRNTKTNSVTVSTEGRQLRAIPGRLSTRPTKTAQSDLHKRFTERRTNSVDLSAQDHCISDSENFVSLPNATTALHSGNIKSLTGREKEVAELQQIFEACFAENRGGSVYISGAPGTGKTATVSQEVEILTHSKLCQSIFINCMQMVSPRSVFSRISELLSCQHSTSISTERCISNLEKYLVTKCNLRPLIIVLDEIDRLAFKCQEVLYTIFGWPNKLACRLIIIGIANALDLTERLLPALQSNTLRPLHIAFPPYTKDQIIQIITSRLVENCGSEKHFDELAIQLCAKKVAAFSGDIRTALGICRRAIDIASIQNRAQLQDISSLESNNFTSHCPLALHRFNKSNSTVPSIHHIAKAIQEVQTGSTYSPMRTNNSLSDKQSSRSSEMPLHHKLVLAVSVLLRRLRGLRECSIGQLYDTYRHVTSLRRLTALDMSEFFSVCELLDTHGLLRLTAGSSKTSAIGTPARMKRVSLLLDEKTVENSLGDDLLLSAVLSITSLP